MYKNVTRLLLVAIGLFCFAGSARAQDRIQEYFNETSLKVKAAESPAEKREILSKDLDGMNKAIEMVQRAPLTSEEDRVQLDQLRTLLQDKRDELAGVNGFDRVSDDQIDSFSAYIVQDMEQAQQTVTISVVTLLLVLIIILLIA